MRLKGRSAIITGAGRGLGAQIARSYVKDGASVLLCARSTRQLAEVKASLLELAQDGQVVEIAEADVGKPADIEALFQRATTLFPRLDILVCNAGVYGPFGPTDEVDIAEWTEALATNLLGTLYPCRAAIPLFKAQSYGKIIIMSGGGATRPMPNLSAYSVSKTAVVRLAETLAGELKEWHVDVNSLAPGLLATSMQDSLLATAPDRVGAGFHARMKAAVEAGGDSIELASELAVYLASSASDGLTGRLISAQWDPWPFSEDQMTSMLPDTYTLRRMVPPELET